MGAVALGSMAYGVSTILTGGVMMPAMLAIYGSMSAMIFLGNVVGKAPQDGGKFKGLSDKILFKHNHSTVNIFNVLAGSKALPKVVIMGTGFLAARIFPLAALALLVGSGLSYLTGLNLGNIDRLQKQKTAQKEVQATEALIKSEAVPQRALFLHTPEKPFESKIFPKPRL